MRYVTLSADLHEFSLRGPSSESVSPTDLGLPAELADDLVAWNAEYQVVIPMGMAARQSEEGSALIEELDRQGLDLASRIASVMPEGAKVAYYSEGRLRRISEVVP